MTAEKFPGKKHFAFGLLLLTVMLCSACGAKLIRGASPMVRMTELSHQDNRIALQLSIRNLNGVPLDIRNINFSLTMNDDERFNHTGPAGINIPANGTETWSVEIEESGTTRELLDTLQNGDLNSLPYLLKGSITTNGDGTLRFEQEGHIYPLPGRPGHFR